MKFIVATLIALFSLPLSAASAYRTESIILLQPDFVLKERISSVESLSDYIKAVQAAVEVTLDGEPPSPTSGHLVLAVRPRGQSMVWLDFKPSLPHPTATLLKTAVLAVSPFPVKNDVVVFSINLTLWEATPTQQAFPFPSEWSKAMEGHTNPMMIDDIVDRVWLPESSF